MTRHSDVNTTPRMTDEQWQSLVRVARRLAEQVAVVSRRLAAIERRLDGDP